MKLPPWIWVALGSLALVGFGAGFLTGRLLPAHHYERFGTSPDLFDTATGHVCTLSAPPDPFAAYGGHAVDLPPGFIPVDPSAPKNADGLPIVGVPANATPRIPLCDPQ